MTSSISPVGTDTQPISWHYFDDLRDAMKAARAADILDLPFVLYRRDQETEVSEDEAEIDIGYVVVLLPPDAEIDLEWDEDDADEDGDGHDAEDDA